jgi:hypothetical protein
MRGEHAMDTEAPPICDACRRIPISHLSLDVSEPIVGWEKFFEERYITVMEDSMGRPSVARHVLGDLIAEQREREARLVEEAAAKAATLVQPVAVGVPALEDGSAFESLMQAEAVSPQQEFGRPRPDFLAEEIEAGRRKQLADQAAISARKERER